MTYRFRAIINDYKAKQEEIDKPKMFVNFTNNNGMNTSGSTYSVYLSCNSDEEARELSLRMEEILNENYQDIIQEANELKEDSIRLQKQARDMLLKVKMDFPILLKEHFPEILL